MIDVATLTSPCGTKITRYVNCKYWTLEYRNPKTQRRTRILEHRHVWESAFGPLPRGYIVHHIDGDSLNNELSNLRAMTISDHTAIHNRRHPQRLTCLRKRDDPCAYRAWLRQRRKANRSSANR